MTTPTVAEIVTFRLKPDVNPDEFSAAAHAMTPFLRSTGAMLSRSLSADQNGLWTDHITWTTMKAAQEAAKAMFEQPEAGPFMGMIDPADMVMRHAHLQVYLPPE
ncbi:MAG: hypothetical protein AAF636_25775 [Pseudomonadota bacterium]